MITKNELLESARFSHFKPHQQEKNYIQSIVLNSIYSSVTDELVFKGGTCLLFFYGLNRFSEDLDFTSIKGFDEDKVIHNIKRDLDNMGVFHRISKIKRTKVSFSFKISAHGPLFTREIEKCYVKIEISKREKVFIPKIIELKSSYRDIPSFSANVMSEKEILAEKIRALLTRNQARDLFDIFFLLKKGIKFDKKLINEKMNYYKKNINKKEALESVKNKKEIWFSELNAFVFGDLPKFEEVKKYVCQKIKSEL